MSPDPEPLQRELAQVLLDVAGDVFDGLASDWQWVDERGVRLAATPSSWSVWVWRPRVPVPFKRNKRRYGR